MLNNRVRNVMRKEWQMMSHDVNSVLILTLLPLLIIVESLVFIWVVAHFGADAILGNSVLQGAIEKLKTAIPAVASLPVNEQLQAFMVSQMNFYILVIPTMIAITFATFSIVDEKLSGSLEALLATPVRTWELLMGKALAAVIPAVLITWVCGLVLMAGLVVMGWGQIVTMVLNAGWYISVLLLTPAVALLSFLLGVIGSSKAKDPKSAQNIAVVVVLPAFALIAIQVTGLVWFSGLMTLLLTVAVFILDYFIVRAAVALFDRESIVVNWR